MFRRVMPVHLPIMWWSMDKLAIRGDVLVCKLSIRRVQHLKYKYLVAHSLVPVTVDQNQVTDDRQNSHNTNKTYVFSFVSRSDGVVGGRVGRATAPTEL